MSDATLSTLTEIRTLVRRLTRSPSSAQISDADIDKYVNTFILYDFPEELKLFSLRRVFSFYCSPYIDTYATVSLPLTDPMWNFKNNVVAIYKPVYIAGYPTLFTESREQFYGIYPAVEAIRQIALGDGVTLNYTGTLSTYGFSLPVLRGNVLFSSIDINNNGLSLIDVPIAGSSVGNVKDASTGVVVGTINYITGAYNVTFLVAPQADAVINCQAVPYVAARPQAVLYFNDEFKLRPVPDQPYRVDLECYVRPTELLAGAQVPDISEWWQYIAYGAAKKIFEGRMDMESIEMIMPEFKHQASLVRARTINNMSNERTATIYTEQVDVGSGLYGFGGINV